jgi:hypothetical protein
MDDAEGDSVVVAFPQALEQGGVKGGLPAGLDILDGLAGLAQDGDHVGGPGLQAAGPSLVTARQRRMTWAGSTAGSRPAPAQLPGQPAARQPQRAKLSVLRYDHRAQLRH